MTLIEVFMESKEIKRLIVQRSMEFNIPLEYVCRAAVIDYNNFMVQYINSGSWDSYKITEEKFLAILDVLGIKVRFNFVLDKGIDMNERARQLAKQYAKKEGAFTEVE